MNKCGESEERKIISKRMILSVAVVLLNVRQLFHQVATEFEHVLFGDRKSILEIVSHGIRHNLGVMLCSKSGTDTDDGLRTYVS